MNIAVLNPVGEVAAQEKSLMITAVWLILLVVIPVIIMVFVFAWKYRASNTKATYKPNWNHNTLLEIVWWGIPSIIITILAVITWITTHKLDPYRKLDHPAKPLEVQVVALDWKWLFFYPEQNIATVNYIHAPVNRPINFTITADAPMNSFMIPQLGGQIYAMQGMETKLHLISEQLGTFDGYSANYSGHGFSGMHFKVNITSEADFQKWVNDAQKLNKPLTKAHYYEKLLPPTKNNPVETFSTVEDGLYKHTVNKYMMSHGGMEHHTHHDHHHEKQYSNKQHVHDVTHVAEYYKELKKHAHH
jgi:cytochrome o ubiquinol oxidase subunit II